MIDDLEPPPEFSREDWQVFKSLLHRVVLDPGTILFEEGTEDKDLYFIREGSLRVTKKGFHIASLGAGNWVGEISPLTGKNIRTATVTAETSSILWKLSLDDLNSATWNRHDIYLKLITTLSKAMADRVSTSTSEAIDQKLESVQTKIVMAEFLFAVLFGLASFLYALKIISLINLQPKVTAAISIPLILFLSCFLLSFIKKSGLPLESFGLTWKNWKKSVTESLLCTIPMLIATASIKWGLITTIPTLKQVPLLAFGRLLEKHLPVSDWFLITIGYSLFVPLQSLMVNGCMQSTFTQFFMGPSKNFRAIVLSNLIFSALHLHLSLPIAVTVFFIGCVWGWLYTRHQSIVGISASHIIMGIWGDVFLGAF